MTAEGSIPFASVADLAILKGAELTGVYVWKHGVTLSFNNAPLTITVENNAEFQSQGRTEIFNQEIIIGFGARMLSLVGRCVSDFQPTEDKNDRAELRRWLKACIAPRRLRLRKLHRQPAERIDLRRLTPQRTTRNDRLLSPRNRLRAGPLHHRPGRRQARRRHRAAQPLAAPAARRQAARGGAAEEHPDDRADRRRQDRDFAAAGAARRRAVHQGRGDQIHRGGLCRPRRRADRARPGRGRHRAHPREEAQGRAGPRRAGRRDARHRCPGRTERQRFHQGDVPQEASRRRVERQGNRDRGCSRAAAACRCSRSPGCPARRWAPSTSATSSASSAAAAPRRDASPWTSRTRSSSPRSPTSCSIRKPLVQDAIKAVEQNGIVFLDEIDKIAGREGRSGADVSREGVQRDLLPLIEGTTVSTKHGAVKTDHILFIASGRVPYLQAIGPVARAAGPVADPRRAQAADARRHAAHPDRHRGRADQAVRRADGHRRRDARIHRRTPSTPSPTWRWRSIPASRTSARGGCRP